MARLLAAQAAQDRALVVSGLGFAAWKLWLQGRVFTAYQRVVSVWTGAGTFAASSPVGQMLRGERDFWRNQIKKHANAGVAS